MVMPRSRSISMESSTCSLPAISRSVRPPVTWIRRSASVDFPWSIWATMEKLRMLEMGAVVMGAGYHSRPRAATILLYFQALSSRLADSKRAKNALRNADGDDLDPIGRDARKKTVQPKSGTKTACRMAGRPRDRSQGQPLAGDPDRGAACGDLDLHSDQSEGRAGHSHGCRGSLCLGPEV